MLQCLLWYIFTDKPWQEKFEKNSILYKPLNLWGFQQQLLLLDMLLSKNTFTIKIKTPLTYQDFNKH